MQETHIEYRGSPKSCMCNSPRMGQGQGCGWADLEGGLGEIKEVLEMGRLGSWLLLFTVLSWAISLTSLSFSFFTCEMGITLLPLLPPLLPSPPSTTSSPPFFLPLPSLFPSLTPRPPHFLLLLHLFKEKETSFWGPRALRFSWRLPCKGRRRQWK